MPFAPDRVRELLRVGENETVEFKSDIRDPTQLARILAAFANTSGGVVIIGIREPDRIVGSDPERTRRVYERAQSLLQPPPATAFESILIDGTQLSIITVDRSPELVMSDLGAFERKGETIRPMPAVHIARALTLRADLSSAALPAEGIAQGIAALTEKLDGMQQQLTYATSIRGQAVGYAISGLIGAILSLLLTLAFL